MFLPRIFAGKAQHLAHSGQQVLKAVSALAAAQAGGPGAQKTLAWRTPLHCAAIPGCGIGRGKGSQMLPVQGLPLRVHHIRIGQPAKSVAFFHRNGQCLEGHGIHTHGGYPGGAVWAGQAAFISQP